MKYSVIKIKEYPLREKMYKKSLSIRKLACLIKKDHGYISRIISGFYTVTEKTAVLIINTVESYEPPKEEKL